MKPAALRVLQALPVARWLELIAVVGIALVVACGAYVFVANPQCLPRRYWTMYITHLERKLRNMFLPNRGAPIALGQLGCMLTLGCVRLVVAFPYWYAGLVLIAVFPSWYIERLRRERNRALEGQVEPFVMAFANALKTTPSIGNALEAVHPLLPVPMKDEIGLVLKEVRVGSSLEQALLNLSARVRITELEATLSSVLVGRLVGGNLPEILDTTAATLREMARLAGIVRSKTASGRAQLVILAIAPPAVLLGFETVSPNYFGPLSEHAIGWLLSAVAGVLWVVAVVSARKILAVDL